MDLLLIRTVGRSPSDTLVPENQNMCLVTQHRGITDTKVKKFRSAKRIRLL